MSVKPEPSSQTQGQSYAAIDAPARRQPRWDAILSVTGVFLAIVVLASLFYKQTFTSLSDREAMDIAQVARNIANGKGFTTGFVRPFDLAFAEPVSDALPELHTAPLYPCLLAFVFGLRGPSEQAVVWLSLAMMLLTAIATYVLGKTLFDRATGILAAILLAVSAPVLKAGTSGQEWATAALFFTLLLCVLAALHRSASQENKLVPPLCGAACGLLLAALYTTHHILVFLLIPVAAFIVVTGARRWATLIAFIVFFAVAASPLVYRNTVYTGSPLLGGSTWDVMANSSAFPGDTFYRSTDPANRGVTTALLFPVQHFWAFARKLAAGSNSITANLAAMLGLATLPFALVSVLYKFKQPHANAVRGMLYLAVPLMTLAFASFSVSTTCAIIFVPAAAVFASNYFRLLVASKKLHPFHVKAIVAGLLLVACAPAVTQLAWKTETASGDSPLAGDAFFAKAGSLGASGVIYTDVPWTAAWRTTCTAVWLPKSDADVTALDAAGFPMQVVILTPESAGYSDDEAWRALHRVRLWREYIADPDAGYRQILAAAGIADRRAKGGRQYLARLRRAFAVSKSIAGLKPKRMDPLAADDVQVLIARDQEP